MSQKNNDGLNEFERILLSKDDKSAIISIIVKRLKLWNLKESQREIIDLDRVMENYANDEKANTKNLLSILMYDWCELKQHKSKYPYFFERKIRCLFKIWQKFVSKIM